MSLGPSKLHFTFAYTSLRLKVFACQGSLWSPSGLGSGDSISETNSTEAQTQLDFPPDCGSVYFLHWHNFDFGSGVQKVHHLIPLFASKLYVAVHVFSSFLVCEARPWLSPLSKLTDPLSGM